MVPDFVDFPDAAYRVLPPGIHRATVTEIEQVFVDAFPNSTRRRKLFEGWKSFRYLVRSQVPIVHERLDGSFVTDHVDPKDVDVAYYVDFETFNRLPRDSQAALRELWKLPKNVYYCDAYIIFVGVPARHPQAAQFDQTRDTIEKYWETCRDLQWAPLEGSMKGYIEVQP